MSDVLLETENAVYLENSFLIEEIVARSRNIRPGTTYDLHLRNNFVDSSGEQVFYRDGINLSSRILGINQRDLEERIGPLGLEDLSKGRLLTLGLAIPSEYGHVEHHGAYSTSEDIEIVSFERRELYTPGIEDEQTGPLTLVKIRTEIKGQEIRGFPNYSLNLAFDPEKFDELQEYFSQRERNGDLPEILNRAPLRVKKFELS